MNQQQCMSADVLLPNEVGSAFLANSAGLHARPAIKLTKTAMRYQARVLVSAAQDGPWVNAKSIALVMRMKTRGQRTLYFSADGDDAEHAVRALIKLVEGDFSA